MRPTQPLGIKTNMEMSENTTSADTTLVPTDAILDHWSRQEWDHGVQIEQMEELESLAVRTQNSLYEIVILSGHRG
jgi:hypothetical protein